GYGWMRPGLAAAPPVPASSCRHERAGVAGYWNRPAGDDPRDQQAVLAISASKKGREREIDMSTEFMSPATMPPPVGYSHIAKVNKGTLIYLAGQVSSDASGALVGEGNFEAQAERVYANVKLAVEAAGATMADIVKLNTYIVAEVDPAEIPKMR